MSFASSIVKTVLLSLISIYRKFSRLTPQKCRFYPTCSCYAKDALNGFPLHIALGLTLRRISRCHPLNPGGVDLLPSRKTDVILPQ